MKETLKLQIEEKERLRMREQVERERYELQVVRAIGNSRH